MNIYLPQSEACAGELKYTMHSSEHIINGGAGIVQDSALAAYFLSLPNTIVRKSVYFDCIFRIEDQYQKEDTLQEPFLGRKLLSCFFEPDFNITGVIENGQVITTLNKKILKKKILKKIYQLNPTRALHFLRDLQRVAAEYLRTRGFSIGISTLEPRKELNGTELEFQNTVGDEWYLIQKGRKERQKQALQIQKLFSKDNNFISLTSEGSGAKGSLVNLVQMRCSLGQQYYKGSLLPKFRGNRFLSSDAFNDESILTKGFITGNFLDGLTPKELFQHSISSRLSLLDTALKTAETGYSSRRLSFCLQDILLHYDNTIRNGDRILRFNTENKTFKLKHSTVEPGEPLGIVASQMIGQMVMQLTLNTFHSAGEASDITSGVPRMEALINNWKKRQAKQRLLYRKNIPSFQGHQEIRMYDYQVLKTYILNYNLSDDFLEITLNKIQLTKNRIHQWDIHMATRKHFGKKFKIEIINYQLKLYRNAVPQELPSKQDMESLTIRGQEKKKVFWTNNVLSYRNFTLLEFKMKDFFLQTYSTSINETLKLLGIEAARAQLLVELKKVFNDGVESLFLEVLVEWMMWLGQIAAVTRSGLKLSNPSVLKNMAFERSLRVAADSATMNMDAEVDGTSERIICNKRIKQGTGLVNFVMDSKILDEIKEHKRMTENKRKRFEDDSFDDPWILDTPQENPFVGGGGFNATGFGTMPSMQAMQFNNPPIPFKPSSPAYDPFKPPSPAYDPFKPPSPAYDPFKPPSPEYIVPKSPEYDPNKPEMEL